MATSHTRSKQKVDELLPFVCLASNLKTVVASPMLLVVDFLNVAYRSFFAIRNLTNSKGVPTNAVYGFLQTVRKWIEDCKATHVAIVLDAETPQRRLDLLPEYKAHRQPIPDDLPPQLKILNQLFPLLGWPTIYDSAEEADDLAAALALKAANEGYEVRIGSNDKDFFQIVNSRIMALRSTPKETILAGENWVRERWGIEPSQVADFLALVGDSVDNIPGIDGIGEKTALDLVRHFGSIEKILASLDQVQRPKIRKALEENVEGLRRNLEIIRLNPIANLPPLDYFRLQDPQYEPLLRMLSELEFKSLFTRYQAQRSQTAPEPRQATLF